MHYQILEYTVFSIMLILCRIGTFLMFMPGISEKHIPARIKIIFVFLFCAVVTNSIQVPQKPDEVSTFFLLVFSEVLIGMSIGLVLKITESAFHIFGSIFANQAGLSMSTLFDPTQSTQSTSYGTFLNITFITLLLATDMHIVLLNGILYSYSTLSIGSFFRHYDTFIDMTIKTVSYAFDIGLRMSAPFLIFGMLLNIGSGVMSRLMPQMQVFFILMPAQIVLHTAIFLLSISATIVWFYEDYKEYISNLF